MPAPAASAAPSAGALGWVPSAGSIGVGLSIFSYNGGVTIGLRTDAGLVPDPEAIIADLDRELEALERLRPGRGQVRATAAHR
jgi:diacylglycerol O-acyltransferase / wax synthase